MSEQEEVNIKDKIAEQKSNIEKKLIAEQKKLEKLQKQSEEFEKLEDIPEEANELVTEIKGIDQEIEQAESETKEQTAPLEEQIKEIKAKLAEDTEEIRQEREYKFNQLVEQLGETAAKMLLGKKSTTTNTGTTGGAGRKSDVRDDIIEYLDQGDTFEEIAEKVYADEIAAGKKSASERVGLVKRHLNLEAKEADGRVRKIDSNTFEVV